MKKTYMVSLCRQGVLGGWIIADEAGMTYRTGKTTVDRRFRNLQMPYRDMAGYEKGRWTVSLHMKNGETFPFLVFAGKSFIEHLHRCGVRRLDNHASEA